MAARVLTYKLGLPSYAQKVEKLQEVCLAMVYGEWVFSDAAKNGTIFSRN